MSSNQTFTVFGEPVEVLVSSAETHGSFCILVQTCPPGGGPPPHVHAKEDEIFTPLEGEFELFDGKQWHPLIKGQYKHTLRGQVHTFRNAGPMEGKMLVIVTPGGLDEYLKAISPLQMPQDLQRLTEISDNYGIKFITPEPPQVPPV